MWIWFVYSIKRIQTVCLFIFHCPLPCVSSAFSGTWKYLLNKSSMIFLDIIDIQYIFYKYEQIVREKKKQHPITTCFHIRSTGVWITLSIIPLIFVGIVQFRFFTSHLSVMQMNGKRTRIQSHCIHNTPCICAAFCRNCYSAFNPFDSLFLLPGEYGVVQLLNSTWRIYICLESTFYRR